MKTHMSKNALFLRLPLIALFSATTISMLGSVLTLIAIPWFVLVTTGSATKVGLTAFCETVAIILAGFLLVHLSIVWATNRQVSVVIV